MKIYKYGKMTYPIRECPHCGCVFQFDRSLVHGGGFTADHKERKMVICPDCLRQFEIENYNSITWSRNLPVNMTDLAVMSYLEY